MRIWIIRGNRECSRASYDQSISEGMQNGARRFDDVIDRIWCKVIPVTGMWNHTIWKQRSGWIQPSLRQASGSMNDSWTTPDGVHHRIRLHRSAPQGSYEAGINIRKDSAPTTIRKIETDLWRSRRRYAADERFNKGAIESWIRSRQDTSKDYSYVQIPWRWNSNTCCKVDCNTIEVI